MCIVLTKGIFKNINAWGLFPEILQKKKIDLRCGLETWIFYNSPDNYIVQPRLKTCSWVFLLMASFAGYRLPFLDLR